MKLIAELIMNSRERILALLIERLVKEYNRNLYFVSRKILEYLPKEWTKNATPAEMEFFMNTLNSCMKQLYDAALPLTKP